MKFKHKPCQQCAAIFAPNHSQHKFCSGACYRTNYAIIQPDGCWLWRYHMPDGYGVARWSDALNGMEPAHRYMYRHNVGEIPDGHEVLHQCDVKPCVNPSHLRTGTHAENMREAAERKRMKPALGERNSQAKLSNDLVLQIYAATGTNHEVAKRYGVNPWNVRVIRSGAQWNSVTGAPKKID